MKIHYKKGYAGIMLITKCGLCFWPEVNNYYPQAVVVKDKTKVTCKTCYNILLKQKEIK